MGVRIAFVLLTGAPELSAERVFRELAQRWPDLPPPVDEEAEDRILSASLAGADVFVAHMPAPVPWSDLEGPCATSLLWKDAAAEVQQHSDHLLLTVRSELEPLAAATLLTQLATAVLAAEPKAIGVYWGDGALVSPKTLFMEMAAELLPDPPLLLWIDFRVFRGDRGQTQGFTQGMKAFGHLELETQAAPGEPSELFDRLVGFVGYLLENGPVVEDGHTIGNTAEEKIQVRHAPSSFGLEGTVMRLEFPGVGKPWWKVW